MEQIEKALSNTYTFEDYRVVLKIKSLIIN